MQHEYWAYIQATARQLEDILRSRNILADDDPVLFAGLSSEGEEPFSYYPRLSETLIEDGSYLFERCVDRVKHMIPTDTEWRALQNSYTAFSSCGLLDGFRQRDHGLAAELGSVLNGGRPISEDQREKFASLAIRTLERLRFRRSILTSNPAQAHCTFNTKMVRKEDFNGIDEEFGFGLELERKTLAGFNSMYFHYVGAILDYPPIGAFVYFFDYRSIEGVEEVEGRVSESIEILRERLKSVDHEPEVDEFLKMTLDKEINENYSDSKKVKPEVTAAITNYWESWREEIREVACSTVDPEQWEALKTDLTTMSKKPILSWNYKQVIGTYQQSGSD